MPNNIEKYSLGLCWALFSESEGDCPKLVGVFVNEHDAEQAGLHTTFEPSILPATIREGEVVVCNDINVKTHNDLADKLSIF